MTTEVPPEIYPWDVSKPDSREAVGPRVQGEVRIMPETEVEPYDYGTGCHVRIGDFFGSNILVQLGCDDKTRRDACDRLIAALTVAREWAPQRDEEETRDDLIDAGLGTGYIGEFR